MLRGPTLARCFTRLHQPYSVFPSFRTRKFISDDRVVFVATGERDRCYTGRLLHGVSPNFTSPVPSFSIENQELGSPLATDRDLHVTVGEK